MPSHAPSAVQDLHAGPHHSAGPDVTRPQIAVVALLTVLALAAAVGLPATQVNLQLSAEDVGGAVMPPGMSMDRHTSAEAMRGMAAVDPDAVTTTASLATRGDQVLQPQVVGGVKVFRLTAGLTRWHVTAGQTVDAYTFNGMVPGPRLRVTEGDQVRVEVTNRLGEPTSVHWHGLVLPNAMDGAAGVTQDPIQPGRTYTYAFNASRAGTYFYHSHAAADRQQSLGLYGALIVDPRPGDTARDYGEDHDVVVQLQEWLHADGFTFPAMVMDGALPNWFTLNGRSYPATETIRVKLGERVRVRFVGTHNNFVHPMHIHGGPFQIVETDGEPVPPDARLLKDTVNVGPGERYDVIWTAREVGRWLLHCHIPHHTTNDNVEEQGGGGLMAVIDVTA